MRTSSVTFDIIQYNYLFLSNAVKHASMLHYQTKSTKSIIFINVNYLCYGTTKPSKYKAGLGVLLAGTSWCDKKLYCTILHTPF